MTDALEARAIRLGFWLTPRRQAIVSNRLRGELALFVKGSLPATLAQVQEALSLVEEWMGVQDVIDTQEMSFDTALFIGRDNYEPCASFQLVPAPTYPQAHLLWQIDEHNFELASLHAAPPRGLG